MDMKLTAFRIKNFRSIVDTGWQALSHDNITSLIGQNESGKTSILEAIKAFHDGVLIEDMLRSDLSLPEVSCRFSFSTEKLEELLDLKKLEPKIRKEISSLKEISLMRIWDDDLDSYLIMGDELQPIFDQSIETKKQRELKLIKSLESFANEAAKAREAFEKTKSDLADSEEKIETLRQKISDLKRTGGPFSAREKKKQMKEALESENLALEKLLETKKEKLKSLKEKQKLVDNLDQREDAKNKLENTERKIREKKNEILKSQENLKQIHQFAGIYSTEKEQRAAELKEVIYRNEIAGHKEELEALEKEYEILQTASEKVFNGENLNSAIEMVKKENLEQEKFYNSRQLADELFRFTPEFALFEDFSSLLPNRIDLEDIMIGNTQAEGYKAAMNFLAITGLDYSFFQQPSSRILKQKIENLNGELTLNFQDFWRQNVGKNNKIKINFELAHYDFSHPEKSGRPFIEFWIKDDQERLYPKQRSRGVRWFLSFYLELRATALSQGIRNKVLLIDEPGVSLHARAQEDVLKVFDDIKKNIQIIYSTHSPHLIDVNKLYRILAVQRAVEDDLNTESTVFNVRSMRSATADTLSPIYSMMGARLSQQEIIKAYNNVVVKDIATYYFLKAILQLTGFKKDCYFLPASGTESMPMMVNILIGWGLEYIVINFGNPEERAIHEKLRKNLFDNKVDLASRQLMLAEDHMDVEDMFSTIDFKKYIVQVREGITVRNSEYLLDNNFSRAVLASNFLQEVTSGSVQFKKLDEETQDNLNQFVERLKNILK